MRSSLVRSIVAAMFVGLGLAGCASTPASDGVTRDFVAMTTTGDSVSGESFRGQVTIVDFWAVF